MKLLSGYIKRNLIWLCLIFLITMLHLGYMLLINVKSADIGYSIIYTANALNVRSEPSIKHDENIVGKLKKGDEVEIVEIKDSWGKISMNKWINLKYCKKL